ncbi:MAG: AAA family ATPase [Burkholderiales bacterium]|nr:AAA family ATPase [Burkholderiales bacterium]
MTDIERWLAQLDLEKYAPLFAQQEITLDLLPFLTEADIDALALPIGPRRRILNAVRELASSRTAASTPRRGTQEGSLPLRAERRQLTVMFCDLVGSTQRAVALDPEVLRDLMQTYYTACNSAVAHYGGYVAQYLGDGVMIYFGWPGAHEDNALRGVLCGLAIVQNVKEIAVDPPLAVRIGIATGSVIVGEASPEYDEIIKLAVGEPPHLAARLQAMAEPDQIIIAATTRRLVGAAFDLLDMGTHTLKGIPEPVRAWRVVAERKQEGRFEAVHGSENLTPLVARREELIGLIDRWREASSSQGRAVLISGEPGIGKSRLVRVLRETLAQEDCSVMQFQCSEYHVSSPLHPITEQFAFAAGFAPGDTPEQKLDKLEAVLVGTPQQREEAAPLLASLLSLPTSRYPDTSLSPARQREKTLDVLMQQFEALSRRKPALIVFEDIHWIDPSSEEVLDTLICGLQALPVLLVATYRPEYVARWGKQPHVLPLHLRRLAQQEVATLIENVARKRMPAEILTRIGEQTDGVPLFIEELTKSVLESGNLRDAGDHYDLRGHLLDLSIPTTLRDSLLARIDRLAPVKDVIQTGACIGREFSLDLISRISTLSVPRLEQALQQLTEAGLLYQRATPSDTQYTFKHALVQEAAYDSLLKSLRQHTHARIARVLKDRFADRVTHEPEVLAHHYTKAGLYADAIPCWCEAGKLAVRRVALQEAVNHFKSGLSLIEQLPASAERDELELSIREPLNAAWTGLRGWAATEVSENARKILALAQGQGKAQSMRLGLWAIWVNTVTQGRVQDSLEWSEQLLSEGARVKDLDLRIFGHGASMISNFCLGRLIEAREHGDRILELYDPALALRWMQITAHDLRTLVGVWSCQWTWMLGYPDQAMRLSHERDAYARQLGNAFNLGFALSLGAYVFDYRCEPDRLLERVEEADRLEREHSVPFVNKVMVRQVEGLARLRRGELSDAIRLLQDALQYWNTLGGRSRVPFLKAALAEALARSGRIEDALHLIDECLEQIERPGWRERSHYAEVLRLKGWMLIQEGRKAEAETFLHASIEWAREQQAKSWELRSATTLAELLRSRGDTAAARSMLAPVYGWFTEGFDTHDLKAARALLDDLG